MIVPFIAIQIEDICWCMCTYVNIITLDGRYFFILHTLYTRFLEERDQEVDFDLHLESTQSAVTVHYCPSTNPVCLCILLCRSLVRITLIFSHVRRPTCRTVGPVYPQHRQVDFIVWTAEERAHIKPVYTILLNL